MNSHNTIQSYNVYSILIFHGLFELFLSIIKHENNNILI